MRRLDAARIRGAIDQAQAGTTGRIGVRVIADRTPDALETARAHFAQARLHEHEHRNAVVFLVAPRSRRFAVYGDRAIHERVGDAFWSQLVEGMTAYFKDDRPTEGLLYGIARVGEQLREHCASGARA